MNLLGIALLLACVPAAILDYVTPIWKAEPAMEIRDAYKWLYQATRGGEHAAPDRSMAKGWLDKEWSSISAPFANEAVWKPLCKDGSIGRVNLRPFKQNGGSVDDLVDAFINGAKSYKGTEEDFLTAWHELGKRLKKKRIGSLDKKAWIDFDKEMKAKKYPAVHHSEKYQKALQPAYRILPAAEMKALLKD